MSLVLMVLGALALACVWLAFMTWACGGISPIALMGAVWREMKP